MTDILVRGLVKAFEEDNNILDGLSLEIRQGERVGLLGDNGAGKTTLFRLLTGELREDEGDIIIPPGKRLGLISQIPDYPGGFTVEDVLKTAHERIHKIEARMRELAEIMSGGGDSGAVLREYDNLSAEFDRIGGYDAGTERNRVANGLDIPLKMRELPFSSLSGGEQTRVNLARLILEDTDILLLDEPTNHLDLHATEWLEEYLLKFRGTVLAISHDRYFLDRIAQRTIEIVNGRAEFYSGNYSFYAVEKQRRREEQLMKYEKEQSEAKRLSEAADRLAQWGTGNKRLMKKSQAIRSRIERVTKTERPDREKKMHAGFSSREFRGDQALMIEGLSKSYGERTLFSVGELEVTGGERIALIGDNGAGKSTLIRILMEQEEPDSGRVRFGPAIRNAYLPQLVEFKNPNLSVLDTLIYEQDLSPQSARNRLGAFKFSGEDVFRPVWALSGGERSRLRLCILMREEVNFLILDEPTNHLDIQSREWMEEALEEYDEALLFVSHDRYFIGRFATRIWELSNSTITDFRGSFSEYRKFLEKSAERERIVKNDAKKSDNKKKAPVSAEKQMAKLEREIEKLEEQIRVLDAKTEEFSSDYQRLLEISDERAAAETELDALYVRWEELSV